VSIAHVSEQDDTVAGELVQIQALSTVLARNLRVWMEFVCGRFQSSTLVSNIPIRVNQSLMSFRDNRRGTRPALPIER